MHHAIAVISYDEASEKYRFRSHMITGETGDYEAELVDGDFVRGFETPRGKVRFTIGVDEGEWHELGHFSPDGENWFPFFQMDLKRVDS